MAGTTFLTTWHNKENMIKERLSNKIELNELSSSQGKSINEVWIANAAIASSISPIAFVDETDKITYVNLSFLSIWGYDSSDAIIGKNASKFWRLQGMQGRFTRKMLDKGGWIGEVTAYRKSGQEFPVQVSATMLTDTNKDKTCLMVSFIDISARVNAQEEQRRLLQDLRERVKELTCLYKILSIPHSSQSTLEDILRDIVAAIPLSLQWPGAAYARIVVSSLDVRTSNYVACADSLTIPLPICEEGGYLEVGYRSSTASRKEMAFLSEERDLLQAAALEIAHLIEHKRTENELRINRERLLHADKLASIGVLSTEIMHEIGNPNNFIAINTRMLAKAWENALPILDTYYRENGEFSIAGLPYSDARHEIVKLLAGISEGSERIKKISSRLRNFAAKTEDTAHELFKVNDAVRKAIEFTRDCIKTNTNCFEIALDPSDPVSIGISHQIQQVIINLITNACQAITSRQQHVSVTTCGHQTTGTITITIEDDGCGIEPQDLPRIIDPFYSTKREKGNSGLGLSISKDIMNKHNGRLSIHSIPGHGTRVELVLPFVHTLPEYTREHGK
jgi:PAS domain S-box-containing protein